MLVLVFQRHMWSSVCGVLVCSVWFVVVVLLLCWICICTTFVHLGSSTGQTAVRGYHCTFQCDILRLVLSLCEKVGYFVPLFAVTTCHTFCISVRGVRATSASVPDKRYILFRHIKKWGTPRKSKPLGIVVHLNCVSRPHVEQTNGTLQLQSLKKQASALIFWYSKNNFGASSSDMDNRLVTNGASGQRSLNWLLSNNFESHVLSISLTLFFVAHTSSVPLCTLQPCWIRFWERWRSTQTVGYWSSRSKN